MMSAYYPFFRVLCMICKYFRCYHRHMGLLVSADYSTRQLATSPTEIAELDLLWLVRGA